MKPWYKSRTLWVNVVMAASTGAVGYLMSEPAIQDSAVAVAIVSAVNIFLRTITKDAITLKNGG